MNAPATLNVYFDQQNIEKTVFTNANPIIPISIDVITLKIVPSEELPHLNLSFKITGPDKINELDAGGLQSIIHALDTKGYDRVFTTDNAIYHVNSNEEVHYQSIGAIVSLAGITIDLECLGESYRCEMPQLSNLEAFALIISQGYLVFNRVE